MDEVQYIRENVRFTVIATITATPSVNIRILEKKIKEHFIDRGDYVRIVSSVSINPHQDGTAVLSFTKSNEADTDISGIQAVLLRELAKSEEFNPWATSMSDLCCDNAIIQNDSAACAAQK